MTRITPHYNINSIKKYLTWHHSPVGELCFDLYRFLGLQMVLKNVQGSKMLLDLTENCPYGIHTPLLIYGVREPLFTEIIKRELEKGLYFIDIGANIGYFTLLASKIVTDEGWVYAIEPSTRNFILLYNNVKINGYRNISLHKVALGDKKCKIHLKMAEVSNLDSITYSEAENTVEVEMSTLDNFLVDKRADFMKMDTEGFEYYILRGMERTLQKGSPLKIAMEFHPKLIENYGGSV